VRVSIAWRRKRLPPAFVVENERKDPMIGVLSGRCSLRGSGVFRKLSGWHRGLRCDNSCPWVDIDDDGTMEETIQNGVSNRGIAAAPSPIPGN